MGLQHNIETDTGVTVTYLNIQSAFMYYHDNCADITISGYINKQARINGKSPIYSYGFRMEITDDTTRAELYDYIKTLEPFIGATDA